MTDKTQVRRLHEAALKLLIEKFGPRVRMAGGSYTQTTAKLSFEFELVSGELRTEALRKEFTSSCYSFNLLPNDFDLPLQASGGETLQLTGLKLSSFKYPFVGVTSGGRHVKFGPQTFLAARARKLSASPRLKDSISQMADELGGKRAAASRSATASGGDRS